MSHGGAISQFSFEGMPDAPMVVLSTSLGTTADLWAPQLAAFVPRLQLLRYDHPGHGVSPVPQERIGIPDLALGVVEMLDRLELERASFCGISLGDCVGMWLAAHAPQRVDKLVLPLPPPRLPRRTEPAPAAGGGGP